MDEKKEVITGDIPIKYSNHNENDECCYKITNAQNKDGSNYLAYKDEKTEAIAEDNQDFINCTKQQEYYDEFFYNIITKEDNKNGASFSGSPSRMSLETVIDVLHRINITPEKKPNIMGHSNDTQFTGEEDIDTQGHSASSVSIEDNDSYEENSLNITPAFDCSTHQNLLVTSPLGKSPAQLEVTRDKLLCLVRNEKYQEALKLADDYLQWDSSDAEVLYAKGYCYYALGQYEKAIEHFEQVIINEPTHVRALTKLKKAKSLRETLEEGDVYFIDKKWEKALVTFDEALEIDCNSINLQIRVHRKKAEIYLKLGKIYKAVEEYTNALLFDENCLVALRDRAKCYEENCGDYEKAIKDFEKIYHIVGIKSQKQWARNCIKSIEKKIKFEQQVDRAQILMEYPTTKNVELALKVAEECLQFNKYDARAICVKGSCLYYKDQYEEAIELFGQVQPLDVLHPKAQREIEKIKRLKGTLEKYSCSLCLCNFEEALSHLNEAINIDNSNASLNARLLCKKATVHLRLQETYTAIQEYSAALELDETCLDALCGRAQCYEKFENYEEAIEDYKKAYARLESGNMEQCAKQYTRFEIENMKQRVRDSISTLEKTVTYKEKVEQAEILMENNVTPKIIYEALNLVEECLQFNRLYSRALCVKGSCLYYLGHYKEALRHLQLIPLDKRTDSTALKIDKISRLILLIQRGDDAVEVSEWHDAFKHYNEALNIDRSDVIINSRIICKKAAVYLNLNEISSAIQEYSNAIKLHETCLDALRRRAECYEKVEAYESAIEDYKQICIIVDDAAMKQGARDSIATLEQKISYREKVEQAERLMEMNVELALNLAEECLQHPNPDKSPLIRALFVKGSCFYYLGQYKESVDQFQQILRIEPSHSPAQDQFNKISTLIYTLEGGEISLAAGRMQDALNYFEEALNIDEGTSYLTVSLHCKIAQIFLKLDDIRGAIEEYTIALAVNNECVEAVRGRAECYADVGDYKAAIEDYLILCEIEECEENQQRARERLAEVKTLEEFKTKKILKNLTDAELLIQSVTFANLTENVETALKLVEECLQLDNCDTRALYLKGSCLYFKGQYKEAVDQFQQLLRFAPSHSTAREQFKKISILKYTLEEGEKSLAAGRLQEALNCFKEAINIDDGTSYLTVRMQCKIAEIYLGLRNICLAIEEYTIALEYDDDCVEALRGRAKCYADSKDYTLAIEDYLRLCAIEKCEENKQWARDRVAEVEKKKIIEEKVTYAESLIQEVKTDNLAKNVESALKIVEECLQLDGSDIRALCVKGSCLYYKGLYNQALFQFKRVLKLQPSHSTALRESDKISRLIDALAKGENAFVAKIWHDALNSFNEALTIDGVNTSLQVELYCKMAAIYWELKEKNRAIDQYTNALSLDSECVEALRGRAKCYTDAYRYEDALKDYKKLSSIDRSEATKEMLRECKAFINNYRPAQVKAEMGNRLYIEQKYTDALAMFKEAIRLCPDRAEFRVHAFSCYMKLSMLSEAATEAKKAVDLYVKSSNSFSDIAKCYIALGDISSAEKAILKASAAGINGTLDSHALDKLQRLHDLTQKYMNERNHKDAVKCVDQCLQYSPFSSQVKLMKAECLVMLGKTDEAVKIADECLESDRSVEVEARFMKGLCLYYDDDLEGALKYFSEIKDMSPHHERAHEKYEKAKALKEKKQKGKEALKQGRWRDALQLFSAALSVDSTLVKVNVQLHLDMATAHSKLREPKRALEAYVAALDLHEEHAHVLSHAQYVQALALRAACLAELGEHEDAVDDYERLYKADPRPEFKELLDRAKQIHAERSKNKDYYKILGVPRTATKTVVLQAYRKLVKIHHPDKQSGSFAKKKHERRLQEIDKAKTELFKLLSRR